MAIRSTTVSQVVVDISAALNLVDGEDYAIQPQGGSIFISSLAAAPAAGTYPDGFVVHDRPPYPSISAVAGEKWYAWAFTGAVKIVVLGT